MKIIPNYLSDWKNNLWFIYNDTTYVIVDVHNAKFCTEYSDKPQIKLQKGWMTLTEYFEDLSSEYLTRIPYDFQKSITKT